MPQDKVTEIVSGEIAEGLSADCVETSDTGIAFVESVESGRTVVCDSSETERSVTSSEAIEVSGVVCCVTGAPASV